MYNIDDLLGPVIPKERGIGTLAHYLLYTQFPELGKYKGLIYVPEKKLSLASQQIIDLNWSSFDMIFGQTRAYLNPHQPIVAVVRDIETVEQTLKRGISLGLYSSKESLLKFIAPSLKLPYPIERMKSNPRDLSRDLPSKDFRTGVHQ